MINDQIDQPAGLHDFVDRTRAGLERALVARFGLSDGIDAAAEALAYAAGNWDRLASMQNPAGYLYRVGQTHGRILERRWNRLDVLVDEPRSCDEVVDVDLQRALLRLGPEERVSVVLVHAHGYSYADAAEILDVPVTTVTNYLSRGLKRLRRILET